MDANKTIEIIENITEDFLDKISLIIVADKYNNQENWFEIAQEKNILIEQSFQIKARESNQKFSDEKKWKFIAYTGFVLFLGLLIINISSFYFTWQDVNHVFEFLNENTDDRFVALIIVGFVAQMIDGALGMGYGVTSTAALLYFGVPLPSISSSIHTAEMFSSGASGFSHYKFGNINKKLFKNIVLPGIAGAVLGAVLLSTFGEEYSGIIKPILAIYTLLLGVKIFSNAFKKRTERKKIKRVGWLAGIGGFLDSFGGGGWGPVVTSTLISKGKTPKYVIGTVSLTEFFVTLSSAFTFFTLIGIGHWQLILGLVIGGMLAAPLAAKLAGKLPVKKMFLAVGLLIIVWSLNIFLKTLGIY
ncbi:sulfite exporter TauE/SafE family protein [Paenimyroides tangerinum]|uniref:Probable membrane transporter protein n=2 Tax=Paenimyroides tangerinum TaxID=2488728 RepID=A0A3P3WE46_9FLAO|nr:sulfite exporter TauE/SafE family protein [Paenimyroides tangerinum]